MSSQNNYTDILNQARRKRKKHPYRTYLLGALGVLGIVGIVGGVSLFYKKDQGVQSALEETKEVVAAIADEQEVEIPTLSVEELELQRVESEKQAALDSYTNLGMVQVDGYLNIRVDADVSAEIIGKAQNNNACSILGEENGWYHIISGDVEGYISADYVLTDSEALELATEQVALRAIITTDKLNIRKEPRIDPENVVGQAYETERYLIEEQLDGWVKVPTGYISSDYISQVYALDEARKLDMKEMAVNQYDNIIVSKVSNYLNIRSEPVDDGMGNVIGKFPGNAAGEILESVDGWYKIKSGPITGYVSSDSQYVAIGGEARTLALQAADLMAIVNTDRLNVRTEPSTESAVWTQISKEERYPVISELDGWVEIEVDGGDDGESSKAFISTRDNNVEVSYTLPEAIKFSPLEEAANQQMALRNKVVNYALQFVGNPYVWGGTNPNTGADCSGFVQYVLRNAAGVSIPRVSRDQAQSGRAVSASDIRAGDLVFYTNSSGTVDHVAMYIGNGQVVHAASSRSGIKISTWNYRTPKYIRNMLD